eukprot:3918460-Lingulodinium_polyedra.AAC.1
MEKNPVEQTTLDAEEIGLQYKNTLDLIQEKLEFWMKLLRRLDPCVRDAGLQRRLDNSSEWTKLDYID